MNKILESLKGETMKQKKRKRSLDNDEKRRLKKYVYFFLIIVLLALLSFLVIFFFSKKNIINGKTEMIALFGSLTLLMIGIFPAALIGKRIEDNSYYDKILNYIDEEDQNNLKVLYEAYMKDIIDDELIKYHLNLFYYPLLFDPDYSEFNFYTYNYLKKGTQFIIKFLKDEIMYFVGDSKILDSKIHDNQWIKLDYKKFESISDIVEFINDLYKAR
jgi:hypothetical protein